MASRLVAQSDMKWPAALALTNSVTGPHRLRVAVDSTRRTHPYSFSSNSVGNCPSYLGYK